MAQPSPEREPYEEYQPSEEVEPKRQKGELPEKPKPSIRKLNRIINYLFVIVEGLIALRLLLKVLGANPTNGFVNFIYSITFPFVAPFQTAFNGQFADTGVGVLEFGSLLAIAFYILLNYAIVKLIWILTRG